MDKNYEDDSKAFTYAMSSWIDWKVKNHAKKET